MTTDEGPNPTVILASDGTWLAFAGPTAGLRAGAWGHTKEEATAAFHATIRRLQEVGSAS